MTETDRELRARIVDALRSRQRFVLSSHVRPDGDAIGSQLAMAYALRALGKDVRLLNRDPAPSNLADFPGVSGIEVCDRTDDPGDAVIVMECGDIGRTGVAGLDRGYVINIDHHVGNTMYGAINWFDASAAACAEMVWDLIVDLGVPITREIATHVYVAILTDTGSFHYSSISPRTFDICRQCMVAGIEPTPIARAIFDSNSLGRLKIFGAVLNGMRLDDTGRVATIVVDRALTASCGATAEDTEGLVNQPLTVKTIEAVAFFKEVGDDDWRVSLRSKGRVDVNAIAKGYGGGGHMNASGCSATGQLADLIPVFQRALVAQIEKAWTASSSSTSPKG